jgi:uncharacterized membrane protein
MAYSIAGNVYLLPKNRVRPITDVNATDAMKFAISGGVTNVDDDHKHTNDHHEGEKHTSTESTKTEAENQL